eukprot:gene11250-18875_t
MDLKGTLRASACGRASAAGVLPVLSKPQSIRSSALLRANGPVVTPNQRLSNKAGQRGIRLVPTVAAPEKPAVTAAPHPSLPYGTLSIGVPKESFDNEKRVGVTPEGVAALLKAGFKEVNVASGAGAAAEFSDSAYTAAGATIVASNEALGSDIILKVRPPSMDEVAAMKEGVILISHIKPAQNKDTIVKALQDKKANVVGMDTIPRMLSRAQTFDSLSSQANIAGYRAVVEAATVFGRFFTGQITAAGRVPPAKITAAGRVPPAKVGACGPLVEQAKSMGAEFLTVDISEEGDSGSGEEGDSGSGYSKAEMKLFADQCKEVDIVITTALIPGKAAPLLIKKEFVDSMKPGSVIVDLASEAGGNCGYTKPNEIVRTANAVTVIGYTDLPSRLPTQSSTLYNNNITKFLLSLGPFSTGTKGAFQIDYKDEALRGAIILTRAPWDEALRGAIILDEGTLVWPPPPPPPPSPEKLKAEAAKKELAEKKVVTDAAAALAKLLAEKKVVTDAAAALAKLKQLAEKKAATDAAAALAKLKELAEKKADTDAADALAKLYKYPGTLNSAVTAAAISAGDKYPGTLNSAVTTAAISAGVLGLTAIAPSSAFMAMVTQFSLVSICGYQTVLGDKYPGTLNSAVTTAAISAGVLGLTAIAPSSAFMAMVTQFSLASICGYQTVLGVSHSLHSPLMAVTNAISGLTVVGGLLLAGGGYLPTTAAQLLAFIAIVVSSVNIGGGFTITDRMLGLFRRPDDPKEHDYLFAIAITYGVYLVCSALCIAAIGCLGHQATARTGTTLGLLGVFGGVAACLASLDVSGAVMAQCIGGITLGCGIGYGIMVAAFHSLVGFAAAAASITSVMMVAAFHSLVGCAAAASIAMMVAAFHSLVGFAAAAASIASVMVHAQSSAELAAMDGLHKVTAILGDWIGALTLTGSAIAFAKLHGIMGSSALSLPGKNFLNMAMLAGSVYLGYVFMGTTSPAVAVQSLVGIGAIAGLLGLHLTASIGGADMPVVVTLLNSYSGYALCAEGFMLNNTLLTVVGALIGSSGAILSFIMSSPPRARSTCAT